MCPAKHFPTAFWIFPFPETIGTIPYRAVQDDRDRHLLERVQLRAINTLKQFCEERLRQLGFVSLEKRMLQGIYSTCTNPWREGGQKMEVGSSQWWPVPESEPMGRNWSRGGSLWILGSNSMLFRWQSIGTGCSEAVESPPRRSPEASWVWSWAHCSGCPSLSRGRSRIPFPPQWFCEQPTHICIIIPVFGNWKAARIWAYLAVGADEEWLHFDAVIDHRDSSAGADRGCIAGGGGDDGVGHTGTAQRRRERGRIGGALCLAVRRLYMADGIVGSGEGRAGVFDADNCRLLEGWRLLGWLVSAWGNGEAVWNQGLWPNLKTKLDVIRHNPTLQWINAAYTHSAHRLKLH